MRPMGGGYGRPPTWAALSGCGAGGTPIRLPAAPRWIMAWRMPAETAPHERTWMAFPRAGSTLAETDAEREECYAAWSAVALAIAEFEPVAMLVDPTETTNAHDRLGASVTAIEAPVDEFWMRDH